MLHRDEVQVRIGHAARLRRENRVLVDVVGVDRVVITFLRLAPGQVGLVAVQKSLLQQKRWSICI